MKPARQPSSARRPNCSLPGGIGILLVLLIVAQPLPSISEDVIPSYDLRLAGEGRETYLQLDQAIAAALSSNLQIKIEAISPQLEEQRTLAAIGEFDPAFESRFRYDNIDTAQTSQEFVGTGGNRFTAGRLATQNRVFKEDNFEGKTGIVGKLRTGAEYDFSVRTNRFVNDLTRDPTVGRFNPEFRSFTGLTFLQPLLRDAGREVNQAKITVSHRNEEIADQLFRQELAGIVRDVIAAYYDAFLAYEDAMVKRFEVEVLRRLAIEKRDQLERGAITERELDGVKAQLSESYERFLLARQTLLTQNGDLLLLMQQEFQFNSYPVYLPVDAPSGSHPDLDPVKIACEAMENRPSYLMAVEDVEKLGIVLKYRENQLLPRIDLEGTIGYSGLEGNLGRAFNRLYHDQGHEYGIGLVFNAPLRNTENRALMAETEGQHRQALLRVRREELETNILINRHITAVQTHGKRLHAARMSTRIEEANLEKTRESLEKGTISESTLMKVERDVSETRLRQYAAAADLQKSLTDLWETNGTLLSKYGVEVTGASPQAPATVTSATVRTPESGVEPAPIPEAPPLISATESEETEVSGEEPMTLEGRLQRFFRKSEKEVSASLEEQEVVAELVVAAPVSREEKPEESATTDSDSAEEEAGESANPAIVATPVERNPLLRFFEKQE